jgi:hypothetical protein
MNGLLDIFGTSGTDTLGLLGMSPEAIKRSRDDAQAQALYSLAGSLLSGGPTGLSIVRGLQQGSQAYKNAMQGQLQEQFQGFQLQDALRKRKAEEQALARQAMANRLLPSLIQPAQAAVPAQFYGQETQMPVMDDEGNLMPGATAPVAGRAGGLNKDVFDLLSASPEGQAAFDRYMKMQKAAAGETFNLAENATLGRINPLTNQVDIIAQGAPKEKATPGDIQGYNLARSQGYEGSFLDYQTALKKAGASSTSINMPSEGERKSAVLANRMNFSVAQMNEAIGKDPKAAMPNTAAEAARFFTRSDFLANKLTPEQRQVVETAQLDVLDSALTLGTGAAYTREQLDSYRRSYFPQLGDEPKTVQMKQKRLENLLRSAEIASGRAASSIPTKMPQPFEVPQAAGMEIPANVTVRKRPE